MKNSPSCLIFLHVPKTAGSSVRGILGMNYSSKATFLAREMWKDNPNYYALDQKSREHLSLLMGHMPFGLHTSIGNRSIEYFTILREPTARILSLYQHILRYDDHHFANEMQAKKYTLQEILQLKLLPAFDNCQVRMLSGNMHAPFGTLTNSDLKQAIQNLEKHFPIAGIQECFDEFILLLAKRYAWHFPYYRKLKVAPRKKHDILVEDETLKLIASCNQLDKELYDYVKARFEIQIKESGPLFLRKLQKYQRNNRWFQRVTRLMPFYFKANN